MLETNWDAQLLRDTYLLVDLDTLQSNVSVLKKTMGEEVAICAVVKANAYGLGAREIAPYLIESGVTLLAVANLLEAVALKNKNSNWPVWVMGHTPNRFLDIAVKNNIVLTIFSYEQALLVSAHAKAIGVTHPVQVKIDTGFNRLGYRFDETIEAEMLKLLSIENISIQGVFSHLALESYTSDCEQLDKLKSVKGIIEKHYEKRIKYYHICDSISGIAYPEFRLDMVRIGAALLGSKSYRYPDFPIKNVLTFLTRISHVKTIEVGEGVSYDFAWRAGRRSVIATLPFGYADGYPRSMTGKGEVVIHGVRAPIVGVICMDQCMADVTDIAGVSVGDEVIIYGENGVPLEEISEKSGTNKNEIFSRIASRVPRVYVKNGKVQQVSNILVENR